MSRPSSFHLFSAAFLLLLLTAGCNTTPAPALASAQISNPEEVEEVQPPVLPIEPVNDPLPVLGGEVALAPTLRVAATAPKRVQMRLLWSARRGTTPV